MAVWSLHGDNDADIRDAFFSVLFTMRGSSVNVTTVDVARARRVGRIRRPYVSPHHLPDSHNANYDSYTATLRATAARPHLSRCVCQRSALVVVRLTSLPHSRVHCSPSPLLLGLAPRVAQLALQLQLIR